MSLESWLCFFFPAHLCENKTSFGNTSNLLYPISLETFAEISSKIVDKHLATEGRTFFGKCLITDILADSTKSKGGRTTLTCSICAGF